MKKLFAGNMGVVLAVVLLGACASKSNVTESSESSASSPWTR